MMPKHQNDENTQKSVQLNLLFVIKIWMISTLLMIVCLYLIFIFIESYQEDELELTMIFLIILILVTSAYTLLTRMFRRYLKKQF